MTKVIMRIFAMLIFALPMTLSFIAHTQEPLLKPNPALSEHVVEIRAREVGRSLRCVVCQNQSIDESDATLAQDMRKLVRQQIRAGQSNAQVIDYMQDRYGDFVLLKPPVQGNTYILWYGPLALFVVFLIWYVRRVRRQPQPVDVAPLSAEEQAAFERLSHRPTQGEAKKGADT